MNPLVEFVSITLSIASGVLKAPSFTFKIGPPLSKLWSIPFFSSGCKVKTPFSNVQNLLFLTFVGSNSKKSGIPLIV